MQKGQQLRIQKGLAQPPKTNGLLAEQTAASRGTLLATMENNKTRPIKQGGCLVASSK
jgi:hypothetical protein